MAISALPIERLVELRAAAEAEIERLDRESAEMPSVQHSAFEAKDAGAVQQAFAREADLREQLAAEQARLAVIVARLETLLLAELQAARAAIVARFQPVNTEVGVMVGAVVEAVSALEAALAALEQRAPRLLADAVEDAEQARRDLFARCGGDLPNVELLSIENHRVLRLQIAAACLDQLTERAHAAAERTSALTVPGRA
jgi:hypothetical protein